MFLFCLHLLVTKINSGGLKITRKTKEVFNVKLCSCVDISSSELHSDVLRFM